MGLDIKIPIGLMFVLLGALITVYGIVTNSDAALYQKSLEININLWVGLFMVAFGGIMLIFSKRNKKKEAK